MSLQQRLDAPGPKKILALDGGGILGLISVETLIRLETMLREQLGAGPDFVLADYFDLVAGTSTGAMVAACIALGMPTERIRSFYLDSGRDMFDRASLLKRFRYKFEDDKLAAKLQREIGESSAADRAAGAGPLAELGSDRLKSLLLVVTRNASTDSPWPVTNNPRARYNDRARPDCNLRLPLWQLVRASTAAPTYFPPETVTIGPRRFVFVDGGVTPYNNPAFLAFLTATLEPYRIGWATGEEQLLVVSVGTGNTAQANADLRGEDMNLLYAATTVPGALMYGALNQQDTLCRVFGRCRHGDPLDREIGDLHACPAPGGTKLFTYLRFDADVSRAGLDALGLPRVEAEHVQLMDSVDYIAEIRQVGVALGSLVTPEHFAGFV
jgi:patatin-like phospholipase